jgi:hypothetical protein
VALPRLVAWRRIDVNGLGIARFESSDDGELWCQGQEIVIFGRRRWGGVEFNALLDAEGRTRSFEASAISDRGGSGVWLLREGQSWKRNGRRGMPRLYGCADVDVVATAATNTFPIRRLSLKVGQAKTIPVAWIDVPSLRVRRIEQTYRRVAKDVYEYSTATFGPARLTVDEDGIVIDYEGFAERIR